MLVGSGDSVKVWLNGALVSQLSDIKRKRVLHRIHPCHAQRGRKPYVIPYLIEYLS